MIRYRLQFELPGLTRMLNTSGRPVHWTIIAKEKRGWRKAVEDAILAAGPRPPLLPFKRAELHITRFSSTEPDYDNLVGGNKVIVDALRYAGILENDRISNIGIPKHDWEFASPGKGKMRVILISIPDQQGTLILPCPNTKPRL